VTLPSTADLIEADDLDGLLVRIDHLCADGDWDGVVDLRDRCRRAFLERGRQLWPASSHAEYRLALEAPGPWAATVLTPAAGRFSLGPLPEVAASTHAWAELAPYVPATPDAGMAAHERVVRGEDLSGDDRVGSAVLELPLRLEAWEPAYPVAVYKQHEAQFPDVPPPALEDVDLPSPAPAVDDAEACRALVDLAAVWKRESNGEVTAVAVAGDAAGAIAALAPARARMAAVTPHVALATMAWAAASGGAHGRRRGMAAGRFAAWWAVAALGGLLADWPFHPDDVGAAVTELRWYWWDAGGPHAGWTLRLAADDPESGRAWAVEATDRRD
jgi:hypothetical protein